MRNKKKTPKIKIDEMKVCLYLQNPKFYRGSGIGQAIKHQQKAMELNDVKYTLDPNDPDYQILHINSQLPGVLKIIKNARRRGKKIIIHAHMTSEDFKNSLFFSNWIAPIIHWWLNILYSQGDIIICPSTYTKSLLENNYKRLKNKTIIPISNGIDIEKWKHDEKSAEKFRQTYRIDGPIVFAVGLIFVRKGIVDFMRTAKEIPDASFIWVGRHLKRLVSNRELKRELKNKPKNFLSTGFVEEIIGAHSAGDIFFFPSHEENEGIVVLEAAAMGKAIVVRDIPVFRSYMENGKNCLMGKTKKEFVDCINELIRNPKLRKKLSKNARKLAESKSLKNIGKELKEAYLRVLEND